MRIETLRNFLVLADEKNMTKAAKRLHISQPTLSRQMLSLEDYLGKQIYTREEGLIKLTQEGQVLYEYAKSITELETRAKDDIAHAYEHISGPVYIGYGDSYAMEYVFQAISDVHEAHKRVEFNLISGDTNMLIERLHKGSIDFMVECGMKMRGRYNTLSIPGQDTMAAVVGKNSKLYTKEVIMPEDLEGEDIIISRQLFESPAMRNWAGESYAKLKVAVYFNLGMGVFDFAEFGAGCVIAYQELAERRSGNQVKAIPFYPSLCDKGGLVWSKDRVMSPAATCFIDAMKRICENESIH